jgi:uncharacterized protein (DUF1499 family)
VAGCASAPPGGPDDEGRLPPCPSTPNCVSSDDAGGSHAIDPLIIDGDPAAAWNALAEHLGQLRGVTIVERRDDYLRAEARTRLLRFTDDVEFLMRADAGHIAMRSASRIGLSDLGTNRRRLESIRAALAARGVVTPAG